MAIIGNQRYPYPDKPRITVRVSMVDGEVYGWRIPMPALQWMSLYKRSVTF